MIILIDSKNYSKEHFGNSLDFLLAHGLIEVKEFAVAYKVKFVGEVHTPFNYFIAFPKNFTNESEDNVALVKSLLKELYKLKRNGKVLIKNKTFTIGNEITAEYYYWRKLFTFFTDYITYEFYYPKKRQIKHSVSREKGRLHPMLTDLNREKYGTGITYEVKNIKEDTFKNIYYTTLKNLERKFASEAEQDHILETELFLKAKGHVFKEIEINADFFLNHIKTLEVSPLHETIVKTIKNYYIESKIKEKHFIHVFYSKEFEYVFEYLLQTVLKHSNSNMNSSWINPNYKKLQPDIVTETFIGDAKYYKITEANKYGFEKELYAYNIANLNKQSNIVFIPSEKTDQLKTLQHDIYCLEVVSLNLRDVLNDYLRKDYTCLKFVQALVKPN